jgi:predicted RecA/RadA family phage recombinase
MSAIIRDSLANARTLKYAHTAAVEVGEIIVANGNVLVAISAADADEEAIYVYRGRIQVPKTTGAIAAGEPVFWDPDNEYVKNAQSYTAGTAVAGSNIGNGEVSGETAGANAIAETWTFTCTAEALDAGTFSVKGSKTGLMEPLTVGVAYDNGFIACTIADGTEDFDVGDSFTIEIAADYTRCGNCVEDAESADTTLEIMLHEN